MFSAALYDLYISYILLQILKNQKNPQNVFKQLTQFMHYTQKHSIIAFSQQIKQIQLQICYTLSQFVNYTKVKITLQVQTLLLIIYLFKTKISFHQVPLDLLLHLQKKMNKKLFVRLVFAVFVVVDLQNLLQILSLNLKYQFQIHQEILLQILHRNLHLVAFRWDYHLLSYRKFFFFKGLQAINMHQLFFRIFAQLQGQFYFYLDDIFSIFFQILIQCLIKQHLEVLLILYKGQVFWLRLLSRKTSKQLRQVTMPQGLSSIRVKQLL